MVNGQQLKNSTDSLSQAMGQDIGRSLHTLQVDINPQLLTDAILAALDGHAGVIDEDEVQYIIRQKLAEAAAAKREKLKVASDEFMAQNKMKPNMITHESGLQYEVITPSDGARLDSNSVAKVHYTGTLQDGRKFDSSYDRSEPLTVENLDQVIRGWKIGLPLMNQGAKYRFYVPYYLGYGEREMGNGEIPAYSNLIFEIELLDVTTKGEQPNG